MRVNSIAAVSGLNGWFPDGVIVAGKKLSGATMPSYHIYIVGERIIRGRHDFEADDDQNAIQIAHALLDACSDECQSFDLWQGTRRIPIPRPVEPTTFDELSAANQQRAIETEERIVQSEWAIAWSRRLLDRLERKRADPTLRRGD
jgi:hypothetical protein